jgi:hypothetical protein
VVTGDEKDLRMKFFDNPAIEGMGPDRLPV